MALSPFQKIYQNKEFKNSIGKHRKFPWIVDIELTNHCNLNCLFCGQQTMKRQKGFMAKELFEKVVNECAEYNTPIRLIRWGEPFLHPEIIDFCRYAKQKVPVHITTNGTLITEQQMEELINMRLDSIIFSFQGATKEGYEIMRNNRLYDTLEANVLRMVELRAHSDKPHIKITSTMTNETPEEIEKFKKHWGAVVDSVGIGKTNLERLNPSQVKSLENVGKIGELLQNQTIKKEYRPCTEVWQKLSVDWDGKVSACCADWDNFMTIGDVNHQTLKHIWDNSPQLQRFREILGEMGHKSLTLCSVCYKPYGDEF